MSSGDELEPLHDDVHSRGRWSLEHVGAVFIVFSLFAARLWSPAIWELHYVPVISPVYRQQEHWLADRARVLAVSAHVGCGVLMLLSAMLQLDEPTRSRWPWLHRWIGRLYVSAGLGALLSLQWLRSASGAGSARHGDPLMRTFIDCSSVAWLGATAYGVDAIVRRRDRRSHSRAMLLSAALSSQPILQRLLNALLLSPCAMTIRCVYCLAAHGEPPWRARWGAPDGALSLLLAAPAPHDRGDARASPRVFSLDGYGESEQAAFGLSAWLSLLGVLGAACWMARSPENRRRVLGDEDAALRTGGAAEAGRSLVDAAVRYARLARRLSSWAGARATCGVRLRCAARGAASALLLALLLVPLPLSLLLFGLLVVGLAALATVLPVAVASTVATPLWLAQGLIWTAT